MNTLSRIALIGGMVLIVSGCLPLIVLGYDCPGCWRNVQPLTGSAGTGDTTGDELVTVKLNLGNDDAGVNSKIQQAIGDAEQTGSALNGWDIARNSNASRTGYWFFIAQNVNNPNIVVQRGDAGAGHCLVSVINVNKNTGQIIYPITIRIPDSTARNMSTEQLTAAIKHELGHCLGLADTYLDQVCSKLPSGASIMQEAKSAKAGQPVCSEMRTTSIQPEET